MEAFSNSPKVLGSIQSTAWIFREASIFYFIVLLVLTGVLAYELFWLFRKNGSLSQGIFSEKFRDDLAWSVVPLIALIALSWVGSSAKKKQSRANLERPAVLSEVKGGS